MNFTELRSHIDNLGAAVDQVDLSNVTRAEADGAVGRMSQIASAFRDKAGTIPYPGFLPKSSSTDPQGPGAYPAGDPRNDPRYDGPYPPGDPRSDPNYNLGASGGYVPGASGAGPYPAGDPRNNPNAPGGPFPAGDPRNKK